MHHTWNSLKVTALFICVIYLIGCAQTNIKETPNKEGLIGNNSDKQSIRYDEIGFASFISDVHDGKMTASGIRYDKNKMTAAHPSLPFGTTLLITNLMNNKKAEAVVIDRFQHNKDRIINVSRKVAEQLDLIESGIAKVGIIVITKHALNPGCVSDSP
ncbi:MAG: septal ring lytic transglycosylase RlpA family protein [Candidatus Kuenenia sp.]|nr:septal ring lytic transglycosylase RlpA family protein [Candidatus Kuenenia hertensis]